MELPQSFIHSIKNATGFDEAAFKHIHNSGEQITSIRINPAKISKDGIASVGINLSDPVPWSQHGHYLSSRPSFTLDPMFHAGAYYVQEASSMFLETVLKQVADLSQPLRVLDLCAAPGGKSTLIQSLITPDSLLVSNEVIKSRVNILSENMSKWGSANVIVTNNDPKDFQRLENYFDVVVVDAPCSGSGLFRKDPSALEEWSENNVLLCSQRQQRILSNVLPALKPDGVLIYSTCSYSLEEDEAIADWLLGEQEFSSLRLELNSTWNIVETISPLKSARGYRFYPDKVKGEGFFIAAFKKNATVPVTNKIVKNKERPEKFKAAEMELIKSFLKNPEAFFYIRQNESILAMPLGFENDLANIKANLYIKKAGIKLGTIVRNELIPDHELAISTIINPLLPFLKLELETALDYLRRKPIAVEGSALGWSLIKYNGMSLGWVKRLHNRINNYYPKDWRILNK